MNRLINFIKSIISFFYNNERELETEKNAIVLANKLFLFDKQKRKYIVIKAVKGNYIVCRKQDISNDAWRNKHFKNEKIKNIKKYITYETI